MSDGLQREREVVLEGRFKRSVQSDDVDITLHPDPIVAPGAGAVRQVSVDGEQWFILPPMTVFGERLAELTFLPHITDSMYGDFYGPGWVLASLTACGAGIMFGALDPERAVGALRVVAEDEELQRTVNAGARAGASPLDLCMLIQERM